MARRGKREENKEYEEGDPSNRLIGKELDRQASEAREREKKKEGGEDGRKGKGRFLRYAIGGNSEQLIQLIWEVRPKKQRREKA